MGRTGCRRYRTGNLPHRVLPQPKLTVHVSRKCAAGDHPENNRLLAALERERTYPLVADAV